MDTDNHMRTPTFKQFNHIADASLVEELASLGTKPVHAPIKILHPVLPVSQYPIVEPDHFRGDCMGLFNCSDHPNSVRLTLEKLLHAGHDRGCRRAMASARVG